MIRSMGYRAALDSAAPADPAMPWPRASRADPLLAAPGRCLSVSRALSLW